MERERALRVRAATLFAGLATSSCAVADRPPTASVALPSVQDCRPRSTPPLLDVDPAVKADLTALLNDMIAKGIAPGAVLMVEHKGRLIFSHAVGHADREDARPMNVDALFRLYSMTKPITSLAALRLASKGKIALDHSVSRYIPEFAGARTKSRPLTREVTLHDLLTHQAGIVYRTDLENPAAEEYRRRGIPAGPGVDAAPESSDPPVESLRQLAERIATTPLAEQPGKAFIYGNATDVLGRVIEVATGKSLSAALKELVLDPLGMSETAFTVPDTLAGRLTSAYAAPSQFPATTAPGVLSRVPVQKLVPAKPAKIDDDATSIFLKKPKIEFGGAGLVGTAADYLRFTRAVRLQADGAEPRLVPTHWARAMTANQLSESARADAMMLDGLGFGYGLAVRTAPTGQPPIFPRCAYFWGGAASTYFWVDPLSQSSGVLMTQVFGGDVKSYWLAMIERLYARKKP